MPPHNPECVSRASAPAPQVSGTSAVGVSLLATPERCEGGWDTSVPPAGRRLQVIRIPFSKLRKYSIDLGETRIPDFIYI
jgi:hypothetical protein